MFVLVLRFCEINSPQCDLYTFFFSFMTHVLTGATYSPKNTVILHVHIEIPAVTYSVKLYFECRNTLFSFLGTYPKKKNSIKESQKLSSSGTSKWGSVELCCVEVDHLSSSSLKYLQRRACSVSVITPANAGHPRLLMDGPEETVNVLFLSAGTIISHEEDSYYYIQ